MTTNDASRSAHVCDASVGQIYNVLRTHWNEATQGHFRNARVEFLKGIRSLIDARIARLSRQETKGSTVTVE